LLFDRRRLSPKAQEIWRNQSICLPPSNNKEQKYVSISGHAEMIDDRERVKEALVRL